MTKNINVAEEFAKYGTNEKIKTKHFFFEKDVLYSYGFHFPLCIRLKDCWLINKNGYSNTTSKHKGYLIREISKTNNFKELEKGIKNKERTDIKLLSTEELKRIINENENLRFISFSDLEKLRIIQNL